MSEDDVSDFGAYCVEMWLGGRNTKTSYYHLGVDYLRSFAHRTGARGACDLLSQPTRVTLGPEADVELRLGQHSPELGRFIESSALRDRRLSERERIILILYYEWQFNLKEIGDLFSVSESRISQMHHKALSRQKSFIQAGAASQAERERKRVEPAQISREVQKRPSLYEKANAIVQRIREENGPRVVKDEIEEVLEIVFEPFAVTAF